MPDGFEADEEAVVENANKKRFFHRKSKAVKNVKSPEEEDNIILDCENVVLLLPVTPMLIL